MPSAQTVAQLQVVVDADTSSAEKNLEGFSGKMNVAGVAIGTALGGVALQGVEALAGGLASAVDSAASFEQTMSGVKAVSGASAEEMKGLSDLALQLGKDTSFSAGEAGKGIEELVKGGLSIPDIMNGAAKATLDLAAAGGVSLPDAATIAANALAEFNLKGSDMAHVSDMIAGAANASALDVSDFKFSLSAAGAVASTVGFSFDDLAEAIAIMGKAGITGSDAGTSLKTMFMNLQPSTKAATTEMRNLGIITADGTNQFFDASGKVKSFAEVSQVLQNATKDLTEQQKLSALQTMFGSDAIRAAAVAAKEGSAGVNEMADAMGKVTAASVGAQRLDNFKGSMEQLKGSVETLEIALGTLLLPVLRQIVDAATAAINAIIPFAQALPDLASNLDEVFGPGTTDMINQMIATMRAGWAQVAPMAQAALSAVADFFRQYIGIEIAWFQQNWPLILKTIQTIGAAIEQFWTAHGALIMTIIQSTWTIVTTIITTSLKLILDALTLAMQVITGDWGGAWDTIKDMVSTVFDAIVTIVGAALDVVGAAIDDATGGMLTTFVTWGKSLVDSTTTTWDAITSAILAGWDAASSGSQTALSALGQSLQSAWDDFNRGAQIAWDAMTSLIAAAWDAIKTSTETAMNATRDLLAPIWDAISSKVHETLDALSSYIATIWETIRSTIETAINAASSLLATAWAAIDSKTREILDGVSSYVSTIWETIRSTVEEKVNAARDVASSAWESIKTTISTAFDGIKDQFVQIGTDIIAGLKSGLSQGVGDLESWVTENLGKKLPEWAQNVLGIKSPSTVFADIGSQIVAGLIAGMDRKKADLLAKLSEVAETMGDKLGGKHSVGEAGADSGEVADYIRKAASERGIDPDVAIRIAQHEGGLVPMRVGEFNTGKSFWPFQLHYGGSGYESFGTTAGMGNDFTRKTGWQPYDPAAWKDSTDFALDYAAKHGWSAWYGRGPAGVGAWEGIPGHQTGGWVGLHGPELGWLGEGGPEYVVPNSALRDGHGIGAEQTMRVEIAIGGRVAEQIFITGRDLAAARGRH